MAVQCEFHVVRIIIVEYDRNRFGNNSVRES